MKTIHADTREQLRDDMSASIFEAIHDSAREIDYVVNKREGRLFKFEISDRELTLLDDAIDLIFSNCLRACGVEDE